MSDTAIAKLFQTGRSQVVRLPEGFHLPGKEVKVCRYGRGVLLEPMGRRPEDITAIFSEIDWLRGGDFLPDRRCPPPDDVCSGERLASCDISPRKRSLFASSLENDYSIESLRRCTTKDGKYPSRPGLFRARKNEPRVTLQN
jgi:virulence-associated protein VagC